MRTALAVVGSVLALVLACGKERSTFDDGSGPPPTFTEGGLGNVDQPDADLYANDPPAPWCGPASEPEPPKPGGTEQCPDDKNKPGCACTEFGKKASCWTGLRRHRGLGACKDGTTTCIAPTETSLVWGPCEGEKLPDPKATRGPEACGCFSQGQWKIANLSPCIFTAGSDVTMLSTKLVGGEPKCPASATQVPADDWSTDTLKVDCAGHFKLCLRLRQGVFEARSNDDCTVVEVCTESDYVEANVEQAWPNLKGWLSPNKACAAKWAAVPRTASAGYAEMVVKGKSVRCDAIDDGAGGDLVFNRVKYCPLSCEDTPTSEECRSCQQSGAGQF